jgi:hypothetical protein
MYLEKENDRLLTIYDSLLQLYVLRDEARRSQNWHQEATLKRDIEAVEVQWQALRAKRKGGFNWQEMRMSTDRDATRRRHVREQSIIDHVARDLFKPPPEPAAEKSDKPKSTTDTGLPVEEQVRKEWDGSNGGLPTF